MQPCGYARLPACGAILLVFLALTMRGAEPVVLTPRLITLPASTARPRFADIDGDGRSDLLVIDLVQKTLLNYHQRPAGFADAPDQAVPLPAQTVWVAPHDVDPQPGLELLISTATGLVYSRQNAGLFESERQRLIAATQVFTNFDFPFLVLLSTNQPGTNDFIPVISATQAVLYHRDSAYTWRPDPPLALDVQDTGWSVTLDPWADPWALGPNPAHHLRVHQSLRARPEPKRDPGPENEAIRRIMDDMKKSSKGDPPRRDRVDVDGDGQADVVLWQSRANPVPKTDVYFFLRGADHQLPERPSQVLHCHGVPIPFGPKDEWSPLHDLNGDRIPELILLELKPGILTANGIVEAFFSRGLDWSLTIRTFQRGAFPGSPDASVPVKGILPSRFLSGWSYFIEGDFNGDGRPDLLVQRTESQWNVFFSTTDARWFAPQPALTFDAPTRGEPQVIDLNGDGLSDIIWHERDAHRMTIFMSPPLAAKDKTP